VALLSSCVSRSRPGSWPRSLGWDRAGARRAVEGPRGIGPTVAGSGARGSPARRQESARAL
jgi:hypothetical protein